MRGRNRSSLFGKRPRPAQPRSGARIHLGPADGQADVFEVVRGEAEAKDLLEIEVNGNVVYSIDARLVTSVTFNGSDDQETLIVDFGNGDPIPVGGISFVGQSGATGDTLAFVNGTVDSSSYTLSAANEGAGCGHAAAPPAAQRAGSPGSICRTPGTRTRCGWTASRCSTSQSQSPGSGGAGAAAAFSVTASGAGPFTYQWRKNLNNISGATSATLTIAAAQVSDNGTYDCVVNNTCGTVTSNGAVLTVTTSTTIESACVSTAAAPNRALAVDIDGANGQDLIVSVTGGIQVLKNNGLGALVAQSPITTGAGAAGLAAADFDGDTFLDVAVANRDAGTVTVLYGDGTGAFPASFSINAGGPAVAVAACRTVGAYSDLFIAVAGTRL